MNKHNMQFLPRDIMLYLHTLNRTQYVITCVVCGAKLWSYRDSVSICLTCVFLLIAFAIYYIRCIIKADVAWIILAANCSPEIADLHHNGSICFQSNFPIELWCNSERFFSTCEFFISCFGEYTWCGAVDCKEPADVIVFPC